MHSTQKVVMSTKIDNEIAETFSAKCEPNDWHKIVLYCWARQNILSLQVTRHKFIVAGSHFAPSASIGLHLFMPLSLYT